MEFFSDKRQMDKDFKVILWSDPDHERLTAEIYFQDKFVALISQDEGLENAKIEFPDPMADEAMVAREVSVTALQSAIQFALKRLSGEEP